MRVKKTAQNRITRAINVGDSVRIRFGAKTVSGQIVEDRGGIGVKGRRLYRIRLLIDDEPTSIELPADKCNVLHARSRKTVRGYRAAGLKKQKPKKGSSISISSHLTK